MKTIEAIWQFALDNPALLVLPACAFILTLLLLRIKNRYINEGILFRRSPRQHARRPADSAEEDEVERDTSIDLAIALRKFEELGMEDGGSGFAYWHEVGELLIQAADMHMEIERLRREVERCRAMLAKSH
ncbi:hypothetical protein IAG25_38770 [Caballeronia sp. EK]|uniref:hypothetical protein n=1 Tax=Caballeronia sp. EK TaxID=2767469 RepID=UPI0016551E26|nr:hypothetical protein [Caballeronia sp. EK]MBC8642746.1 hypothetical protein [Caballeronia sp. EK]